MDTDDQGGGKETIWLSDDDSVGLPESKSIPDDLGHAPAPGTIVVPPRQPDDKDAKKYKTIHVSASSKARARIRVCMDCGSDNLPEAGFCEKCGSNLDEQEQGKAAEETRKQLQEYAQRVADSKPRRDAKTIFRRRKTPVMQVQKDIEKKSYHSQYIAPGVADAQYDPSAFRSDLYSVPPQVPQGVQQPAQLPVNYVSQGGEREKQASFVIGVAVASVLSVMFISLVVVIIVLLLK